jgi:hypothetical protein
VRTFPVRLLLRPGKIATASGKFKKENHFTLPRRSDL